MSSSGPVQNHPSPVDQDSIDIDINQKVPPQTEDDCSQCDGAIPPPPIYTVGETITSQPTQNNCNANGGGGGDTIVVIQEQKKPEFGPESQLAYCAQCGCQVQTRVDHECGLCAILVCVFLFGVCTYCCNCFKDVNHSCPQCGAFLGRYKRLDF